jgi:hypothetical protein
MEKYFGGMVEFSSVDHLTRQKAMFNPQPLHFCPVESRADLFAD